MFIKLFLPLTIAAFISPANAVTTHSAPANRAAVTPQCVLIAQGRRSGISDSLASSAIGGLLRHVGSKGVDAGHRRWLASESSPNRPRTPYRIAALEMAAYPASNFTAGSCYPALSLASTSMPPGKAGTGYAFTLAANGGQPPYRWSLGHSSLPSGFSLNRNGDLTGTPSAAGTFTFNVIVSDSLQNNVTGELTLNVAGGTPPNPPPPPPPVQPPPVQPPPTQPPPVKPPPPTQPPPTQPPPTQPPPVQPPPIPPPPTQPPPIPPPPTQPPPPVQPPPTQPPTGTALTSCGDITSSGSYYLANDVTSPGTCFGIDSNNISLNLNGHTITYGTGGGSAPTPAIEGHDCWSTNNPADAGPCGSAHGGLEVYGGTIVQSPNSATFSDVFSFGQGAFSSAPYIHNVTATFQNKGARFYTSAYLPPGARIENNAIYDNVTDIRKPGQGYLSARAAFQGQAIYIGQNDNNPGTGDTVSGNKIVGSPQGGVRTVNQHSTISGNDISMSATYSNDFCADVPADYTTVSNNNCHPTSGRGFHVGGVNIVVADNTIVVTELKQNAEYGGCEEGGAYGVQIEDDGTLGLGTNVQMTGNTITALAGDCQANGLRLSGLPSTETATVTGNTFTTKNTGGAGQDFAISVDGDDDAGITIEGNTFNSQYAYVNGGWDSYKDTTVGHNTWQGAPQYTFDAQDGSCSLNESGVSVCPANFVFTDTLPNTVNCGTQSAATVTIGGQVTQCKAGKTLAMR